MLVTDIETYLATFAPWQSGSTVFTVRRGFMPATPDAVIALVEGQGMRAVRAMGPSGGAPLFERPVLEVYVRSPRQDYMAAVDVANQIHTKLDHVAMTANGRRYFIDALMPPFHDGQDKDDRWELVASYLIHKERG